MNTTPLLTGTQGLVPRFVQVYTQTPTPLYVAPAMFPTVLPMLPVVPCVRLPHGNTL